MGRHAAGEAPDIDRIVEDAMAGVGAEIEALKIPHLAGIVLGGGYGRGEGGVKNGGLSNDLDFFAIADENASEGDLDPIRAALEPVSERWTKRLGVDVDFCVRTPWRIRHDQERLMIQELVHGYFDVSGIRGEALFKNVERRAPNAFPWMEAARLMMNRGVGLLLAYEKMGNGAWGTGNEEGGRKKDFIVRNINKCILGIGDAMLIARGEYAWKVVNRAAALKNPLYKAAMEWKFRPKADAVCTWDDARKAWLDAESEIYEAGRRIGAMKRTIYQAARWIVRRRTIGDIRTFGQDCVVRVLRRIERSISSRTPLNESLRKDWQMFN